jgi:uncharacterized membrane protein HdeD (DUF308 family)
MAQHSSSGIVRQASTWSIAWGVLLVIFGMLAVGSPFVAAVAVNVVIAWLIVLAGGGPLDGCFSHSRGWQFDLESVGRASISLIWRVPDHASSTGCCNADFSAGITLSC